MQRMKASYTFLYIPLRQGFSEKGQEKNKFVDAVGIVFGAFVFLECRQADVFLKFWARSTPKV